MLVLQASNRIPFSIIEAGNLVNGEHFFHSRRCLDFFVLLVGVEGKLYISQDGAPYVLEPGKFILLMPHVWHDEMCIRDSPRFMGKGRADAAFHAVKPHPP